MRLIAFVPGLNRISNLLQPQSEVGQGWDYEFNWFGLVITGNSRCTQYQKPSVYQFKTLTGNPSTWTYRFEPAGGRTKLTLEVEYELSQSQLARFATAGALEQMNRSRRDRGQSQGAHRALAVRWPCSNLQYAERRIATSWNMA